MNRDQRRYPKAKIPNVKEVDSLLDVMKDGTEYASIVPFVPRNGDVIADLRKALLEIQKIRGRSVVCYIANVIKPLPSTSIELSDDLPFAEMLRTITEQEKNLDTILVTGGGSGQQVYQFVNSMRPRFETVEFILPYMCMSAGTLWCLSGDRIWMSSDSFIGPIDPQVRSQDGGLVPAQAILVLLNKIRQEGEDALKNKQQPPWHYIRLLDTMDRRQVGDAISLSDYSIKMASTFLKTYKFKNWLKRTDGSLVDDGIRERKALRIAQMLCSNEYWKSHGHGINRTIADQELRIQIDHLENNPDLNRAVRRFWALVYYCFDRSNITKIFLSEKYTLIRQHNG